MSDPTILGWGSALPAQSVAQTEAARAAVQLNGLTEEQARLIPILYRRSGVRSRSLVLVKQTPEGEPTQDFFAAAVDASDRGPGTARRMDLYREAVPPLAEQAARRALAAAGVTPDEITHLVTVSCSGFYAPGPDISLIRALGLPPTVERTHVGFMGCHGALNGLRVARALAGRDGGARVLLCAVEVCSIHYQYGWDPDQVVANALFADGAAAAVIGPDDGREKRTGGAWRVADNGSCLVPDSLDAMSWSISDHGFVMTLSARVPGLIAEHLRPWLAAWLARHRLGIDDVSTWAVHPGGPRILGAVERTLGLPEPALAVSREVLAECGNMSSPTVLFILERLAAGDAPRPCVALAFGPGLTAEAALFG